jgi:hypothetical protein
LLAQLYHTSVLTDKEQGEATHPEAAFGTGAANVCPKPNFGTAGLLTAPFGPLPNAFPLLLLPPIALAASLLSSSAFLFLSAASSSSFFRSYPNCLILSSSSFAFRSASSKLMLTPGEAFLAPSLDAPSLETFMPTRVG